VSMNNERSRILFVCIENAGRSQMAEAFARMQGGDEIEPYSAGSLPSETINPNAVSVMKELGYDLSAHRSKSLDEIPDMEYDTVVTMGCGDECPFIRAKRHVDWNIPDPKGKDVDAVREIRDLIEARVRDLLREPGVNHDLAHYQQS
jgi:arsenate reductase (thioredoxin)